MAQLTMMTTTLVLLLMITISTSSTAEASFPGGRGRHPTPGGGRAYVEAACRTTLYPSLCVRSLSGFSNSTGGPQSPQQLARAALAVSLYKARRTRAYLVLVAAAELRKTRGSDYAAVRDCLAQIKDSIALLADSIRELRRMVAASGTARDDAATVEFHVSNVETWVSGALTEASTCGGQFEGRRMAKVRATIKGKVVNVEQTASNALALFHRFAVRYRAANKP